MNDIITHTFKQTAVRTVERDNLIWFVASDISKALNYRNADDMTRILDDDERGTHNMRTPSGDQEMIVINESGLYHALIKSRKPEAVPFRKWVTGTTSLLSEAAKIQVGGIVKGIVNKAVNEKLQTLLHLEEKMKDMIQTMATGMITSREISVRRGITAGQVWNRHGLAQVKNGPQWLSGKLVECGCQLEGGGCGELGGKTAKLFDPDKADRIMKRGGLLAACHKYVSERCGQMSIGFGAAK